MIIEKRVMLVLPIIIVILGIYIIILICLNIINDFFNGVLVGLSITFLIMVYGNSKEITKTLESKK